MTNTMNFLNNPTTCKSTYFLPQNTQMLKYYSVQIRSHSKHQLSLHIPNSSCSLQLNECKMPRHPTIFSVINKKKNVRLLTQCTEMFNRYIPLILSHCVQGLFKEGTLISAAIYILILPFNRKNLYFYFI